MRRWRRASLALATRTISTSSGHCSSRSAVFRFLSAGWHDGQRSRWYSATFTVSTVSVAVRGSTCRGTGCSAAVCPARRRARPGASRSSSSRTGSRTAGSRRRSVCRPVGPDAQVGLHLPHLRGVRLELLGDVCRREMIPIPVRTIDTPIAVVSVMSSSRYRVASVRSVSSRSSGVDRSWPRRRRRRSRSLRSSCRSRAVGARGCCCAAVARSGPRWRGGSTSA